MIRQYRATIDRLTGELKVVQAKAPVAMTVLFATTSVPINQSDVNVIKKPELHVKPIKFDAEQMTIDKANQPQERQKPVAIRAAQTRNTISRKLAETGSSGLSLK